MTIKELERLVQEHQSAGDSAAMQDLQRKLQGRPFDFWATL